MKLSTQDIEILNTNKGIKTLLKNKHINLEKSLRFLRYEYRLRDLQIELIKLQNYLEKEKNRVAILFEGRDAAGKGGAIRRFVERMNPRLLRVVALPAPNADEKSQWYFQRYSKQLPNKGEIVFFDRSWYNRAIVEPVNNFCTQEEYDRFMRHVPEFELMLQEDGLHLIKLWFSISKEEQGRRFDAIRNSKLKRWKMSPLDEKAQDLYEEYTRYKDIMFEKTHTENAPWMIIKADRKTSARVEAIKYVLSLFDYPDKKTEILKLNPQIIFRYKNGLVY